MTILEVGDVHIWTARSEAWATSIAAFARVLCPSERAVADRYYLERHRLSYRFAHAMLRDILGTYLGKPPEDIRFTQNAFGKPSLVDEDPQWQTQFNLSHSGDVVVVAVTRGRHIGVDVERIRPLYDFAAIAKSNFTPLECTFIENSPQGSQESAFFRCWTRKEAFIKAVGKGLSIRLNTFDVSIPPGQAARTLPSTTDAPGVQAWWLQDLTMPDGCVGAVAVEQSIEGLVYKAWEPISL